MELGICGKNALVTGASRGIGKGVAEALAAEGVNLLLVARSQDLLARNADEISARYDVDARHLAVDFGEQNAVDSVLQAAHHHFKRVDILINISGGPRTGSAMDIDAAEYRQQFDFMVSPFVDLTRHVALSMAENKWGRVISVASSGVIQPIRDLAISNVLRSGLVSWNRTLAHELAPYGVTVNTLIPGRIHTERVDEIDRGRAYKTGRNLNEIIAESRASIPMRRYGTVKEFSAMAAFLASEQAGYITGSCIRVDGGLVASVF